jgi:curved DNA-binding protein CbpA
MSRTLREQIGHKLSQIEAGADHFMVLEVGREASASQIKAAYFQLAKTYHPDRLVLVKLESLRPQVETIFARLSDAYSVLVDDGRRREYVSVLAQGGAAAVQRRADDEAAAATRLLTAEEHFRKGEMAARRGMWLAAADEFQAAVQLNDNEAEHHAYLAWSRWNATENKDGVYAEVRKTLLRATELSDRCVPAFFFLAQVYSARNELDRAYNTFQRVLSLNENHVEARREVRIIEMRRAKGSERKGLFDLFKKK